MNNNDDIQQLKQYILNGDSFMLYQASSRSYS